MFRKRTVLVLGAGSSVEFKLPAGDGLAADIARRTDFYFENGVTRMKGDSTLYAPLRNLFPETRLYEAGQRISEGVLLSRSIDDFLYNHGHDPVVVTTGKAAIAQSILNAERQSTIMQFLSQDRDAKNTMNQHAKTWIYQLFRFIQTDVKYHDVKNIFNNLSIINFNYDRCVEVFLLNALQLAYGLDEHAAAQVMSTLDITHPYGQVGKLPWQGQNGHSVKFGANLAGADILNMAKEIRTYTEQAQDDDEKAHWRRIIDQSEQLIFLGFGFHRQNIDLLKLTETPKSLPVVYATTYRTSSRDEDVFHRRIYEMLYINAPRHRHMPGRLEIDFNPGTCQDLIAETGLALAA